MAIVLSDLKPGTKLRTKGGHKVIRWYTVEDTSSTFFPLRAVIEVAKGVTEEHPYNHNGRRYINTESELDLMVGTRKPKKRKRVESSRGHTIVCLTLYERYNVWRRGIIRASQVLTSAA